MNAPHGLRALAHPDFRRFFGAQMLALIGYWMQTVAQSWLVLQLTDSALRLGLIGTLQNGPVLLLSLFTGAIADRLPKRRILVATQATLATQAAMLGVLVVTDHAEYWHVGVLAVVAGVANAIDMPARQSFVAELVGREDLANAVALNSAAFNAARIVGPAIAGVRIARWGRAPAFAANALGFVVVIATLLRLPAEDRAGRRRASVLAEVREGLRYALDTPRMLFMIALLFAVTLTVFNFTTYLPLYVRHVLGLGAAGFGFLMTALGVGAVVGAMIIGSIRATQPSLGIMFGAGVVACAGLTSMSAVRHVWGAAFVLFGIGVFGIFLVASCNTAMQLTAPDHLRGRVMSLYTLIWGGVFPVGAFLVGSISEVWGVSRAFLTMGAAGLTMLVLVGTWWRVRGASRDAPAAIG